MIAGSLAVRAGLDFSGAWWVAALLAAMPPLYASGHSGFVDVIHAIFILAAARVGFDAEQRKHFALWGCFVVSQWDEIHGFTRSAGTSVVHRMAAKRLSERRSPSKGVYSCGRGMRDCVSVLHKKLDIAG